MDGTELIMLSKTSYIKVNLLSFSYMGNLNYKLRNEIKKRWYERKRSIHMSPQHVGD